MAPIIKSNVKIHIDTGEIKDGIAPIIVSASRSTDIPAFYADWFVERLKRGYVKWVNPFNRKPQYVSFEKTRVVVFWTKNPEPLIKHLSELESRGINYYFQYTVNDYEEEGLEPNVPPLQKRIDFFKELSGRLGKEKVVWRFDPLILGESLTPKRLLEKIQNIGEYLHSYTKKLVFSFADIGVYKKVVNNLNRSGFNYKEFDDRAIIEIAEGLCKLQKSWDIKIGTCAERMNLEEFGISHNKCIDDDLMAEVFKNDKELLHFLGREPSLFTDKKKINLKDKGQRKECGCINSKDIGAYDTCGHLCTYCYANASSQIVKKNIEKHDRASESII